ncbi:MAG: outer membrane protein assembly factor BamA [Burkholderiaceae bacterium]|nr:outer membrane protein assembly factor BamA [Burkholderiaceae bacterium]
MSRLLYVLIAACFAAPAFAVSPFVIRDIRVEGIQRTEPGTIFSYLPIRVGDTFTDDAASQAIRALYATGFFKDVRVQSEGDVVIISIEERPAIASLDISGNKDFETDALKKALKEVGLADARIFDKSVLDRAEQEIKNQYLGRGKYGVKVTSTVTPVERNRVNISIAVDEGQVAKIKEIRFLGNKAFSEKELLNQFTLRTPGWFTFFTKNDQYSKQKLSADLESLRSFYLNQGYLEFSVDSSQVSISPNREDIFVTIAVTEGEKYTVSSVQASGELLGRKDEIEKLISIKAGDTFNGEKLQESVKAITDKLGTLGFAFATINTVPQIDREKRTVAFNFLVDPGRRAYVRRVNVVGNSKTRDEVIRREMRQFESAWYDAEKIRLSRDRVDRLGYFKEVTVDTSAVPGTADQVDVNLAVAEKATGQLSLGIGYNSTDKVVVTGAVSQANVFGSGKTIGLEINTSRASRTLAVSTVDPYYTVDGVSRAIDVYVRSNNQGSLGLAAVDLDTRGASLRYGIPFTEFDTVFFGIGAESTRVNLLSNSPKRYIDFVNTFGNRPKSLVGTVGWARDNRDSAITPSRGRYQRLNGEVSPAGDIRYYRVDYQDQYFWPVTKDVTLALNGQVSHGKGLSGRPYPFFKNVYAGGIGSVRGFEGGSLGPTDVDALGNPTEATGGTSRIIGNLELQIPVPGQGKDKTARMFAFIDGGYVWGENQKVKFGDIRYSAGIGVTWLSPIGPLKLSFGVPLKKDPKDRLERFQFQIGTGF